MAAMTYSYYPADVLPPQFCVTHGANDLLFTEDGKQYIDLLSGSGTVFLGHANPAIAGAVTLQLDALCGTGAVPTSVGYEARSAVEEFLEPLLGSRGGYIPLRPFAEQVSSLCAERGSLLIVDEIFTGFFRTGSPFLHRELGLTPDIVLIGKAMGNGFPVSGVVVDRRHPIAGSMLPGSTFAGNPLAASAVLATLREMRAHDMPAKVHRIEEV